MLQQQAAAAAGGARALVVHAAAAWVPQRSRPTSMSPSAFQLAPWSLDTSTPAAVVMLCSAAPLGAASCSCSSGASLSGWKVAALKVCHDSAGSRCTAGGEEAGEA